LWKSNTSKRDNSARKATKLKECIFLAWIAVFSNKSDLGGTSMLIISRKKDEKIIVADDIEITILEVGRNRVRFGIKAPKDVPIQTRLKSTPEVRDLNEVPEAVEPSRPESLQREMSAGASSSKTS
jgi:carbon storage regulator